MLEHYIIQITWTGRIYTLIWFSGKKDGVVLKNNKLLLFTDIQSCERFARKSNLNIKEVGGFECDFDAVLEWLNDWKAKSIDYSLLLNTWNLLDDILSSLDQNIKISKSLNKIYDKIFWANNLPSVTPEGYSYEPIWSKKEIDRLKNFLISSLKTLETHILIE